jgi:hypothetical protein
MAKGKKKNARKPGTAKGVKTGKRRPRSSTGKFQKKG